MLFNNRINQFVSQKQTDDGVPVWSITTSKEDLLKAFGSKNDMLTIRVFPKNTPKKDKNGNDYIIATVSCYERKVK